MNPSSAGAWSNPPPPGTEVDEDDILTKPSDIIKSTSEAPNKTRSIDDIDPFLKNPQYIEYERRLSRDSSRHKHRRTRSKSTDRKRSRSRSKDRRRPKRDRRRRSKSKSRSQRRSRSRGRHHRQHSRSRSRSRHRHGKDKRRMRSSSSENRTSRSGSRSPNYKSHRSKRSRRSRSRRSRSLSPSQFDNREECDMKIEEEEEEEEPEPPKENAFKNDGSFLEMFKKMQEEQVAGASKDEATTSEVKKPLPVFGKRRGGRVLKTGMVQKTRVLQESDLTDPQDAWSIYMKEVKKYKEACCDDDSKTRPLVK